jgi:YopX protein.
MEINKYMVKAKSTETNEWMYGNYMRIVETDTYYVAPHGYHVYKSDDLLPNSYMQICGIEVDKNTISRPTMLLDKNGNMIWENDVVSYEDFGEERAIGETNVTDGYDFMNYAQVKFDVVNGLTLNNIKWKDGLSFEDDLMFWDCVDKDGFWGRVEVIGNIFDNPELLQTEDDLKEIIEGD